MRCVLTGVEFDPAEQKDGEHIIPASLGGNLKSRSVICPEANNLTSGLDTALYEVFRGTNAQFGIASERDRQNPKLYYFETPDEEKYVYDPKLKTIEMAHPIPTFIKTDSELQVNVKFPSSFGREKSQQQAEIMARAKMARIEEWKGLGVQLSNFSYESRRVDAPTMHIAVDFNEASCRAVLKNAFLYAAHKLGAEQFLHSNFDFIRSIIRGNAKPKSVMCQFPNGISQFLENVTPPNHLLSVFEANSRLWVIVAYYSGYVFLVDLGLVPSDFQSAEFSTVLNPLDFTVQDIELEPKSWFISHINSDSADELIGSTVDAELTINRLLKVWAKYLTVFDLST
jgi:hypothetical protein